LFSILQSNIHFLFSVEKKETKILVAANAQLKAITHILNERSRRVKVWETFKRVNHKVGGSALPMHSLFLPLVEAHSDQAEACS